ncbi:BatD family protein [Psychromonas hadalis]|uniref:BatD family protein n=1 Tax=Psychromonas hadalis TaxID=211669 RepID=UPI0003B346B7|nr:BatD family protein [Psychromonas hadalis]
MKSKFSLFGLLLGALLTSFPVLSAVQVSATVSDNSVVLGDLFILTISINDNDDDYQLDTRPLETSFTVYRSSQSQKTEYINGEFSQQTQWQVRLQAKKIGQLTIPSLKIGELYTEAIKIKVIQASQKERVNNNSAVFIENSIDKEHVYIGQTFIFTTKLYISQNSNELDLLAPRFDGVDATVFGKDKNSQTVRNGIRYNTITRQYKMNATQAGQFEIDSPLLTGTLRKVVAVSEWQNRVISDPINVRGERLTINIKAIPENFQGKWLISEDLRLIEDNNLTAQSYNVGEPITRSITLQIASIDKDKLPNIKLNYPKSLRVYPDQDQLEEGQVNGLTYGIRIIRHAIIADKVGTLTLPEIKLNWFNSRTNQQQTATLPAQNLTIIAAEKQSINIPPTPQSEINQPKPTIIVNNGALIYWQITAALLIVIILFMIFYHLSYRRTVTTNNQIKKIKVTPLNHHYTTLQNSLTKNSARESYKALLAYAQQQYPTLKSLHTFADKTTLNQQQKQQLSSEIKILEKCCSDNSHVWSANKLALLLKHCESTKNEQQAKDPMNLNHK